MVERRSVVGRRVVESRQVDLLGGLSPLGRLTWSVYVWCAVGGSVGW